MVILVTVKSVSIPRAGRLCVAAMCYSSFFFVARLFLCPYTLQSPSIFFLVTSLRALGKYKESGYMRVVPVVVS